MSSSRGHRGRQQTINSLLTRMTAPEEKRAIAGRCWMGFSPPKPGCRRCPRLVALRRKCRIDFPAWHNAPVDSMGALDARILIIGLAPGLRGANRTGRPFTGDGAGGYLFDMLSRFELASGTYDADADDDITLHGVRITNAVRCLPPDNKPVASELANCRFSCGVKSRLCRDLKPYSPLANRPMMRPCIVLVKNCLCTLPPWWGT